MLLVVEGDAVVTAMPEPHPVHVQPPALRVVLVHLGTAHLQLQAWREDPLHSLLHRVLTPVSGCTDRVISSARSVKALTRV